LILQSTRVLAKAQRHRGKPCPAVQRFPFR
jgi:hypothetical protein